MLRLTALVAGGGSLAGCSSIRQDEPDIPASLEDYRTTRVAVETSAGQERGAVTASVADTEDLRYVGLSETPRLPEDRGMLFVFDEVGDRTFVMREMDFPIDIVYADSDNQITEIHHARQPGPDEDGEQLEFPGRGQYVLEVAHQWTTARGVEVGDMLAFSL